MATTHVARDPFARGEYRRESTAGDLGWLGKVTCAWCGQHRRTLYTYTWEPDDRPDRNQSSDRYFCNLGCFRSYHE